MAHVEYGEAPVTANISTQQKATPDELVAIGRSIWQRVKNAKIDIADEKASEALLKQIQDEFHDFNQSFPLVVRWTVQRQEFSARALRNFLMKHAAANLTSRRGFLELQAEYPVLVWVERAKERPKPAEISRYRDAVIENLVKEDEMFTRTTEEVDKEFDARAAEIKAQRVRELRETLLRMKAAKEASSAV